MPQQLTLRQSQATGTDLATLLHSWTAPVTDYQERFLIKLTERSLLVPFAEVCYFEAIGNDVLLHAAGHYYPLRTALGQLAKRLDPAVFLRISRSCTVNPAHIVDFKYWSHGEYLFRMANGQRVTSSRSYSGGATAAEALRRHRPGGLDV